MTVGMGHCVRVPFLGVTGRRRDSQRSAGAAATAEVQETIPLYTYFFNLNTTYTLSSCIDGSRNTQ